MVLTKKNDFTMRIQRFARPIVVKSHHDISSFKFGPVCHKFQPQDTLIGGKDFGQDTNTSNGRPFVRQPTEHTKREGLQVRAAGVPQAVTSKNK